jgi:predicted restriction endonuclease
MAGQNRNVNGAKCIISGCNIEAAHIIPYRNQDSHNIANGLLLRVDLHRLFDKYLLTIDPETRKVLIAPELMNSYNVKQN